MLSWDKHRRQVAPAELRQRTGQTPTALELPADLLDKAVNRIGFLGLVLAIMAPCAYLAEYYLQPARVAAPGPVDFPKLVAVSLLVIGLAVCVLAWTRRLPPRLMLDLGLIFEVVGAFGIALSEHGGAPWPLGQPVRGISWNCLWISVFVVAVPGPYGKIVLAAIASALMSPLALFAATAVNGTPLPMPSQMLILFLPNFVAAGWAIPVARYVFRLGAQVSKAREMGSYQLLELIGKGGMGEVWRAEHRMLARASAIKLIRPEALGDNDSERAATLIRRFEREARATAALRCPHTIDLYDFGTSDDGSFYYVMELLDGLDLESLVERFGPQPPARVVAILGQACKSLEEAHEIGLIHRDVKPKNIFLCRMGTEYDFVKVLDFGLVKAAPGDETQTQLTREGIATGTPAYMAPEMATGSARIDGRADLYALGCVAYWLLTGRLVFESPSAIQMMLAHLQQPPVPPSRRTEVPVPECLERIVMACLAKDPSQRPQSARALGRLLESCDLGEPWTQERAEEWWRGHLPRDARHIAVSEHAETL